MSALPSKPHQPITDLPFWPSRTSKLQAREALKLEPTPGCGRLDRSDFAMWTPEGRDVLRRILRAVIEQNDCACGQHCKPNTGCRSPGPIQDVPFRGQR